MTTPAGEFDAVKVVRNSDNERERGALARGRNTAIFRCACWWSKRTARARPGRDRDLTAVRADAARCSGTPGSAARMLLRFAAPADQVLSRYFREHRNLGQQDRAFVAETRVRGAAAPALARGRGGLGGAARALSARRSCACLGFRRARSRTGRRRSCWRACAPRAARGAAAPRCAPTCPTGCGSGSPRSTARRRRCASRKACSTPRRSTCASTWRAPTREDGARAAARATASRRAPTPYSPAGVRLAGKPAINRHPLFAEGLIEVQDEGSQLLAWLLAPRRGEMVADFCAGAGGKTLALGAC